ncbi:helix-turn-helix transcriptional regulator [Kribbella sp. NPDC023972]|uniref:helix-turn-helix transcriptional regulator n=1 Tax=Kribbella sp. NPDC023972 TaxID=3154795 RepID=UPI00340D33C2
MPFDAYAWLLADPETSVGTAPLADVPCLAELPRLIRLKYVTDVNRWTALEAVGTAHLPDLAGSARGETWADFLAGYGISDVASAVFRDRYGCWGWLDLWRSSGSGTFDSAEVAFLTDIVERVTSAIRQCQANTFVVRESGTPRPPGPAVLVLSPDLDVTRVTPQSQEYLRVLVPPAQGQSPVPANAYNVAAQLLAVETGADQNRAVARVHLADGLWVTLRAARLAAAELVGQPEIAVTIEESSPADRVNLFARSFGLSLRETELLGHLVTGADTRELARRMFLAENTIQDHLKGIFAKTSAHSRQVVVARTLGS